MGASGFRMANKRGCSTTLKLISVFSEQWVYLGTVHARGFSFSETTAPNRCECTVVAPPILLLAQNPPSLGSIGPQVMGIMKQTVNLPPCCPQQCSSFGTVCFHTPLGVHTGALQTLQDQKSEWGSKNTGFCCMVHATLTWCPKMLDRKNSCRCSFCPENMFPLASWLRKNGPGGAAFYTVHPLQQTTHWFHHYPPA